MERHCIEPVDLSNKNCGYTAATDGITGIDGV